MKLELTNKFRVIQTVPGYAQGDIMVDEQCINYPSVFTPLYKFPTGEFFAKGDVIWRINNGDVKFVKLSDVHIEGDIEIFPSAESARETLRETEKIREKKYKSNSIYEAFEKILLFSKTDVDKSSPTELKRILENIKGYAETAFNELKK